MILREFIRETMLHMTLTESTSPISRAVSMEEQRVEIFDLIYEG